MLILLPPSEGKAVPRRGRPLDLAGLSFPDLSPAREQVLDALVDLAHRDDAARGAGPGRHPGRPRRARPPARAPPPPPARIASTPASCTTRSTSHRSRPAPAGGPRRGSPSRRRCSGWSGRTTGSRRTGSPATSRCPASARVAGVWRGALDPAVARPWAAGCSSTSGRRRTPRSGAPPPTWRPGGDRARPARGRREASGGQPLQQGHQGTAHPRAARGRSHAAPPGRPRRRAARPRLEGRGRRARPGRAPASTSSSTPSER